MRTLGRRDGLSAVVVNVISSPLACAAETAAAFIPPSELERALSRLAIVVPVVPLPPEVVGRQITLAERTAVIRAALRGSDTIVLQELLGGVRDRVVVAVTFLALLELSKRREITLEQAEPWGPIVARRLTETVDSESEIDESLESFA